LRVPVARGIVGVGRVTTNRSGGRPVKLHGVLGVVVVVLLAPPALSGDDPIPAGVCG
jgi:hypothetical protein